MPVHLFISQLKQIEMILTRKQLLRIGINKAWTFFSDPGNLAFITPESMHFKMLQLPEGEKMHTGMEITYRVRPLFGIPVTWVTKITAVNAPYYFVDDQKSGPYKQWHHEHFFREMEGGTEMIDIVNYELPFGIVGNLAAKLFVNKRLEYIFNYREKKLKELFPHHGLKRQSSQVKRN
jgi:ligand-binding SRPBCC domain-containing protein